VINEGEGDSAAGSESNWPLPGLGAMMAGLLITSLELVGDEDVGCWYDGKMWCC